VGEIPVGVQKYMRASLGFLLTVYGTQIEIYK